MRVYGYPTNMPVYGRLFRGMGEVTLPTFEAINQWLLKQTPPPTAAEVNTLKGYYAEEIKNLNYDNRVTYQELMTLKSELEREIKDTKALRDTFIFHNEEGITAIDLGMMRVRDRVYDIGFLMAEIKHHFAWRILQAEAAEPFIRNFLWAYCQKFRDPEFAFREITYRNRFFMSLGELRIARNKWLPWKHRKWLAEEALRCLQP